MYRSVHCLEVAWGHGKNREDNIAYTSWRRTNARALIRLIFLDMPLNTTQSPYGTCQKLSDLLEAPFSEIVTNVVLVASYSVSTMKKEEFEVMTVSYLSIYDKSAMKLGR